VSRPVAAARPGEALTASLDRLRASIGVRRGAATVTFLVALVAVSVIALGHPRGGKEPAVVAPPAVAAAPAGAAATLDQAAGEIGRRIESAQLRSLRVGTAEGRVVVTGHLARREADAWRSIERWFDQVHGGRLVLASKVTVSDGRTLPPPQLRAIWFGVRPYIITADGARHEPGSVLDNGWVVTEIGERRLVLAKDGETLALTYP
jgi:hypothetical protein